MLRFQIADTFPPLAYATLRLSGNHDGAAGKTRSCDNCLAFLPSIFEVHTSVEPVVSERNAILVRSGEIAKRYVITEEVSSRIAPLVMLNARSSTLPSAASVNITSESDNHRAPPRPNKLPGPVVRARSGADASVGTIQTVEDEAARQAAIGPPSAVIVTLL